MRQIRIVADDHLVAGFEAVTDGQPPVVFMSDVYIIPFGQSTGFIVGEYHLFAGAEDQGFFRDDQLVGKALLDANLNLHAGE